MTQRPLLERFEKRFIKHVGDWCWMWDGARVGNYGCTRLDNKKLYAHRVSYELYVGPIPEGLTIDHLCKNTLCVNPAHLEPVSQSENTRRHGLGKTHCKRGHSLEGAYVEPGSGVRRCRVCRAAQERQKRAKRKLLDTGGS